VIVEPNEQNDSGSRKGLPGDSPSRSGSWYHVLPGAQ